MTNEHEVRSSSLLGRRARLSQAMERLKSKLRGSTLPKPVRVQEQRTLLFVWGMFVAAMRLTELQGECLHVIRERAGLA